MIGLSMDSLAFFVSLIVYTVASFGLAYIVGHSRISRPVRLALHDSGGPALRLLVEILECPACFGFWTGLIAGTVLTITRHEPLIVSIGVGCYTTGSNFLIGRATGLIPSPDVDF
jgi:ribose/xylose/arabinose/galactoside ABC-type transport system permease subunit